MHSHDNAEALLGVLNAARRNRYFYGKRMDVQHFQMEQDYGKLKQWMLNRLTLGMGVLCGLQVSVEDGRLLVEPGVAIDALGREIVVPVRTSIAPVLQDQGCCSGAASDTDTPDGIYTLWLCYHECLTDRQAVMASTCGSRDECAPSTIVETFCLKFESGMPPLQTDPDWCAQLWPKQSKPDDARTPVPGRAAGNEAGPVADGVTPRAEDDNEAIGREVLAARRSRRHLLCDLFEQTCAPPPGNPCVPLALVMLRGGHVLSDSCIVRPHIYSNRQLLDIILCLAGKIEDCCGKRPATLLHVQSVDFLRRTPGAAEAVVASIATPLDVTEVDIGEQPNAIRIRFSKPLAAGDHGPSTPAAGDPLYARHNVQILSGDQLGGVPYVPGSLTLEAPDTIRFDLDPESPYYRSGGGWQKGRYRIFLRGDESLPNQSLALADSDGVALDGEARAPDSGVMSGNGSAGGDFNAEFVIGAVRPRTLMHVASVELFGYDATGAERKVGALGSPLKRSTLKGTFSYLRIKFDQPFSTVAPHTPSTPGPDDADYARHNVQLLLGAEFAAKVGTPYVPGTLTVEAPDTLRFDVAQGNRVVDERGNWQLEKTGLRLFLRGTPVPENGWPELIHANGTALDGEPHALADGVISGDGTAGGDFSADFTVTRLA